MKFLILSTDILNPSWKTLDKKLAEIKKALKVWDVSMTTVLLTPVVKDGKVDSAWLSSIITPYFDKGYDVVALHISDKQRQQWGILPQIRGYNPNTRNEHGSFYFWADEKTKREGLNQFVQTCLHEFCHEYYQQTGLRDDTHWYHFHNPDITGLVESFDWTLYQPRRMNLKKQVTLLERVKELLIKLVGMQTFKNPFPNFPVSQKFGNRDAKLYPRTKHHLGTDWATPKNTPILSPVDGEVTMTGVDKTRGYWMEITSAGYFWYFFHLSQRAELKNCKQGDVIGFTGNTGLSTGNHCHLEIWRQRRDVSLLTEQNFRDYLIDPETIIK